MAKRILIGYESGEHGRGALELGCALASALGAELVVGHVYAWDTYLAPAPDDSPLEEWHALLRRDAESLVAEALSRCRTDTAPRGIAWASTSPARGLYELATSEEADYVVARRLRRARRRDRDGRAAPAQGSRYPT